MFENIINKETGRVDGNATIKQLNEAVDEVLHADNFTVTDSDNEAAQFLTSAVHDLNKALAYVMRAAEDSQASEQENPEEAKARFTQQRTDAADLVNTILDEINTKEWPASIVFAVGAKIVDVVLHAIMEPADPLERLLAALQAQGVQVGSEAPEYVESK